MTTAFIIRDARTGARRAAAWDAVSAEEKAAALEAGGPVIVETVRVSDEAIRATRRPRPPVGYRIRKAPRLAASTLRRPWTDWRGAWEQIRAAGTWTEWGHGHVDAPTVMALEGRGKLLVAVRRRGRGRNLFLAV